MLYLNILFVDYKFIRIFVKYSPACRQAGNRYQWLNSVQSAIKVRKCQAQESFCAATTTQRPNRENTPIYNGLLRRPAKESKSAQAV